MNCKEEINIKMIMDKIEDLRGRLDKLTFHYKDAHFGEEILILSQDLDILICDYYKLVLKGWLVKERVD